MYIIKFVGRYRLWVLLVNALLMSIVIGELDFNNLAPIDFLAIPVWMGLTFATASFWGAIGSIFKKKSFWFFCDGWIFLNFCLVAFGSLIKIA
jgi:hypothetical protein